MLAVNPAMLPRLDEIETDLHARRTRAEHEGWLGGLEAIDLTLQLLTQKRAMTLRLAARSLVRVGLPGSPN